MTTALLHAAPEFQGPIQASRGFLDHQPSNAGRSEGLLEFVAPKAIANLVRRLRTLAVPVRQVSSKSGTVVDVADLTVVDADSLLAENAVVVSQLHDIPEINARLAPEGDGLRLDDLATYNLTGCEGVFDFRAALQHALSPCDVDHYIGPLALFSQEEI